MRLSAVWVLVHSVLQVVAVQVSGNYSVSSRTDVLKLLLEQHNYDSNIVPDFELNVPTNITVQLIIQNIHSISESTMDFSVELFLRQHWIDRRLAYDDLNLSSSQMLEMDSRMMSKDFSIEVFLRQHWIDRRLAYDDLNLSSSQMLEMDSRMMSKVWTPDTFFPNEKEAYVHDVTALNKLMHLYKDGSVVHSTRLSLRLTCSMKLHKYPLDSHRCPIYVESYAYTKSNIRYEWHPAISVTLSKALEMPRFEPDKNIKLGKCDKDYEETGNFSCISAELVFRRKIGYYIVQIYIPSILIVALSWVSFWVDFDAVPARVSLGIMTVLTMTTQSSGARESLPHVSYIKAIDVWMSMCLLFVFAALLEYAYVNVCARRKKEPVNTANGVGPQDIQVPDTPNEAGNKLSKPSEAAMVNTISARRVDKISRLAFPALYVIFNLVFWAYYIVIPDP